MSVPVQGLIATRRAELEAAGFALHPDNAFLPCSRCGAECAVTPSSRRVLAGGIPLVCSVCVGYRPPVVVMTEEQIAELPLIERLNAAEAGRA